jgi:hypothetical protein
MKKFVVAAVLLLSATAGAAVVSRPVSISRPITISRPVPVQAAKPVQVNNVAKSNSGTNAALLATAAVIATTAATQASAQTVSVADQDADTRLANVNVPLLTVCTEAQLVQANQWQQFCKASVSGTMADYCVLMSFQRYCEPATVNDIKGKQPVRPHYINTYLR